MGKESLLNYSYSNKNGNIVTVIAESKYWCMVKEGYKRKPYVVESELIRAIKKFSDEEKQQTHEN